MSRSQGNADRYWGLTLALSLLCFSLPCNAQGKALSIPVDTTKWLGVDGLWSPVTINLGSPVQAVDLFPSTASQELIVIGVDGCDGTIECLSLRGGVFAANESTTFVGASGYDLGLDRFLGFSGAGYYGLDNVSFSNETPLSDQLIAIVNSTQYWIGLLGLGPSNTTLGYNTTTSFLGSLANGDSYIPSLSYGYTAGAHYRLKQVPASLTMGGYDANRFEANDATFSLDSNQQPSLAINSIIMSGAAGGNTTMIGDEYQNLFVIDSTTPFLWLPGGVADILGSSLGLVYNDTLDIFLYPNSSVYNDVTQSDLSFAFSFADTPGAPDTLSLTIPGQAFTTMNLSFGFPGLNESSSAEPIPYFPVRKAANDTQYILGRSFLQETYLIVDYERNNFSLSQATFSDDATEQINLVNIESPNNPTSGSSHTSLSTGAIIGIAVGIVLILTLIICTTAIFLMRRYYAKKIIMLRPGDSRPEGRTGIAKLLLGEQRVAELPAREFDPADKPGSIAGGETEYFLADKKFPISEVSDTEIRELPTPFATVAVELQGSPVPSPREQANFGQGAVELPDRTSGGIWRSPSDLPSASTGDSRTFLTVSGYSSDGRPSPTSPLGPSSASTRSGSANSSSSLVSKYTPNSGRSGIVSEVSAPRSNRESSGRANRTPRLSGVPSRSDTQYTVDDSISVAFDPRELRDAPKATRRRFSFEEDDDR